MRMRNEGVGEGQKEEWGKKSSYDERTAEARASRRTRSDGKRRDIAE